MKKWIRHYAARYRKECILAPLFKMLEAFFDLLVPLVVARIIDTGIRTGDRGFILGQCLVLAAMALVGLACSFTAQAFAARAATGTAASLRHRMYGKIQEMSCQTLDSLGTSTLITRLTSDVNLVQNGVNMFLRLFLRSPFIVFGAVIMALRIDAGIGLVFVAAVPVLAWIVFGVMRRTSPMYKKNQEMLDRVTLTTRENLSGVRVVRAFGREEAEKQAFRTENDALFEGQTAAGRAAALLNPLTNAVINLCIIAILYFGAGKIDSGALASGNVIALVNYMSQILVELVKLANLIVLLSRAAAGMGRIAGILDMDTVRERLEDDGKGDPARAVAFEGVSMRYGDGEESLTDITFSALPGQTVGIIGSTGAGKSTLVSLISGAYGATEGKVRLFGKDIKSLTEDRIHALVAVVPQRSQLFKGTVRSNLYWGRKDAPEAELWEALEKAQAASFVREKEGGLDAEIEQGGRNLSGGQRQRLTIARALLARPRILILDDASSALDFATDLKLRRALAAMEGTTVFLVSQRTASLRDADLILVLEDGRLVGKGTHAELMETCPVYSEIHYSQNRKEDEECPAEE